ncbi:uncharacterized protein OCT59_008517 [Rhizophagus irregularis]|uniref:uncharacterized protein n=1 Tax=Rhizophagus irregularis TaxID=588596 RepID=UPI0033221798|nr:hypothetical protein OCT59_008517 [Rhizophagus irregularis]
MNPTENKKNLWKYVDEDKYQRHVTISTIDSTTESSEEADDKIVYMEDLEKRKQVYGICGECNEPGTGEDWCQPYFLNEIKSHLQIYLNDIVQCYGITQDPETNEYMMVLQYCEGGNFRNNYINKELGYYSKIDKLRQIASGLLDIHNSGKVHKDFHSGNILYIGDLPYISDFGMCQPANIKQSVNQKSVYGVLPYMAPEVLRGYQYTKASDIYSFGIMMNEYISEETPYNNIAHDNGLAIKICEGLKPSIFKYTPKLLADLITKCWDAEEINRPTAKELYQTLNEWNNDEYEDSDQVNEYNDKIKLNRTSEKRYNNIPKHPQAIYTSRLLDFKNLPEPANSAFLTECLDIQFDEFDFDKGEISIKNFND